MMNYLSGSPPRYCNVPLDLAWLPPTTPAGQYGSSPQHLVSLEGGMTLSSPGGVPIWLLKPSQRDNNDCPISSSRPSHSHQVVMRPLAAAPLSPWQTRLHICPPSQQSSPDPLSQHSPPLWLLNPEAVSGALTHQEPLPRGSGGCPLLGAVQTALQLRHPPLWRRCAPTANPQNQRPNASAPSPLGFAFPRPRSPRNPQLRSHGHGAPPFMAGRWRAPQPS